MQPRGSQVYAAASLVPDPTLWQRLRIKRLTILVSDLDDAATFYERILGLKQVDADLKAQDERTYRIGDAELTLLLNRSPSFSPRHFSVAVDGLEELFILAKKEGILFCAPDTHAVWEYPDGQIHVFLRDPSSNIVEVVSSVSRNVKREVFGDDLLQLPDSSGSGASVEARLPRIPSTSQEVQ
jgi:lactoylglutathione lyase